MLTVMNKLWLLLFFSLLLFVGGAGAAVYKWVDEDGNTIYSDTPHPDGEEIHQPPVQTYKAHKIPPKVPAPEVAKPVKYEAVEILTPLADESIRENTGEIMVTIGIKPGLQTRWGHRVALYIDGSRFGAPGTTTSFKLQNVDRGSHNLRAAIVNRDNQELFSSDSSTFHLQRAFTKSN